MTPLRLAILAAMVPLAACGRLLPAGHQTTVPAQLSGGAFRLDPNHTNVLWKVDHLGFSTYVGRFDRAEGTLDFDPENPAAAKLVVLVDTMSLDTRDPGFSETLRGADWLDAASYPQARFESTGIEVVGPASGRVTGDLTLHGVTQPLTLDVTFNGGATDFVTGDYTLGFEASGSFDRTDFRITTLAPAIGSEVTLEIHTEFLRR